jgi:hypothetical protein
MTMNNPKIQKSTDELVEQGPNVFLYYKSTQSVVITTGEVWYKRLWYLITNPFYYIFASKWRL